MARKSYCKLLGVEQKHIVDIICEIGINGAISNDYLRPIAEKIVEDVAQDIYESADAENWNDDDVRLAVGRVLCKKLRIEV